MVLEFGAVGNTRTPVLRLAVPEVQSFATRVFPLRMSISEAVQAAMPHETGAFAAAIMTGDCSGMGQGTLTDLRASNIAHLLAISGLHMGAFNGLCVCRVLLWPRTHTGHSVAVVDQKSCLCAR
jgi:competence protein ComEC